MKYKIDTLVDMAAIPSEALPRFLEELPSMLDTMRDFLPNFDGDIIRLEGVEWNDDGKRGVNVSIYGTTKVEE